MGMKRKSAGSGRAAGTAGTDAASLLLLLLLTAGGRRERTTASAAAAFLSRPLVVSDRCSDGAGDFPSSPLPPRTTVGAMDTAASGRIGVSSRGGLILASSASSSAAASASSDVVSGDVATDADTDASPPPTSRRPTPSGPPDVAAYSRGYFTPMEEIPCLTVGESSGLPADLVGTYYRAGPAMFTAGDLPPPASSLVQPAQPPVSDGVDPSRMVLHPFEGDGAVFAMTFHGRNDTASDDDESSESTTTTSATARFRYVRTAGFERERKKGARVYTGMDPTRSLGGSGNDLLLPMFRHHLQPGLNRKRKNTSNTRAMYWGKKLLTTWEGGLPYKLDALALSTEGRSQLGGAALKPDDPLGQRGAVDSNANRLVLYSCTLGTKKSSVVLMEFDDRFRLRGDGGYEQSVPGYLLTSDFAVTANYAVFVQPPVNVNGLEFLMKKDPGTSLSLDEDGHATLHLIPRQGSAGKVRQTTSVVIPVDDEYGLEADVQFVNAYEVEGGDEVVVDLIRPHRRRKPSSSKSDGGGWPWCSTAEEYADRASPRSMWRYRVRVPGAAGGGGAGVVTKERLGGGGIQAYFGTINPEFSGRRHRYAYAAVGGGDGVDDNDDVATPPQGVARFDCDGGTSESWFPEPFEFCGEPTYAPRSRSDGDDGSAAAAAQGGDEDDGYVVSLLFNGKTGQSEVIVLDARDVGAGPVARVPLGGAGIPHGYFGCFAAGEGANWSADEIDRRVRLADKMEAKGNRWNEVKSDFSGLGLRLDDFEEYFGVDLF